MTRETLGSEERRTGWARRLGLQVSGYVVAGAVSRAWQGPCSLPKAKVQPSFVFLALARSVP